MKVFFYNLEEQGFDSGKTLEEIIATSQQETILLNISGNNPQTFVERVEALKNLLADCKINYRLLLSLEQDYIYDESEMDKLVEIDNYAKENGNAFHISLGEDTETKVSGTVQNLLFARKEIENLKNKVNNFKYFENGKENKLSPYEKFMIAYKFVANRVYNMDEDFGNDEMRNWIGVLATDKVICSGFASLLKCVCDQLFEPADLKCYVQSSMVYDTNIQELGGHANNLVIINDPKYNLDGLYYADACWDSKKSEDRNTTFHYFMLPITQIVKSKSYKFEFKDLFIYNNIAQTIDKSNKESQGKNWQEIFESFEVVLKKPITSFKNNLDNDSTKFREVSKHNLGNDLMNKYGFDTHAELIEQARVAYDKHQQAVDEYNQNLKQVIKEKLENLCRENNLNLLDCQVCNRYAPNIEKEDEGFCEFAKAFQNVGIEDLETQEFQDKLVTLNDYYENNKEKLNEYNQLSLQRAIDLNCEGFVIERGFIEDAVKRIYYNSVKTLDNKQDYENKAHQQYDNQVEKVLEMGKDFIFSLQIDNKTFGKALSVLAKYAGLEAEEIPEFVEAEKLNREDYFAKEFGIETRVNSQEEQLNR